MEDKIEIKALPKIKKGSELYLDVDSRLFRLAYIAWVRSTSKC